MRNKEKWKPSKYVYRKGKLVASNDRKELGIGSRLIANLVADFYDKHLELHASGKLLDLGCGKVPFYEAYRKYVTDNICVEWINTLNKSDYPDLELDLTKTLPFSDNEFDTIIVSDVLEHIPVPEQLWKEMARILSNNGKIILNVPFYYYLHEEPHDYYRYTEYALRRFVEIAGLRLIKLESLGGALEVVADIIAKNVLRLGIAGRLFSVIIQSLTLAFFRTKPGKKVSGVTCRSFPLGYCLVAEKPC